MKKMINKIAVFTFVALSFAQIKVSAQLGVGPAPYCMPTYGSWSTPCNQPNPSNTAGNWINDFIHSFNTSGAVVNINNNATGCNAQNLGGTFNYFFWGCTDILVCNPGQVISSNFQSGNVFGQGCSVWIDYSQDNIFQTTERVTWTATVPPAGVMTPMPAFTIPAAQAAGVYRMRVRCAYATPGNFIDPCIQHSYGECHDYRVYIGMQPPSMLTATASVNSPICSEKTASLSVAYSGTTVPTFTWSGPGGFTSNLQNPTLTNATAAMSGVYNVTVSTGACPSIKQVTLTVNPTPTITSITNNAPVCQGSTFNLNVTANTAGTPSYSWTGPSFYSSTLQNPSVTNAMPFATGNYSVLVTNTFANGTCTRVASTPVQVLATAPLNVNAVSVCQPDKVTLYASALGATSYSWSGPNSFTSNVQGPQIFSTTPTMSGTYSVTATYAYSTSTLTCKMTNTTTVLVKPKLFFNLNPSQSFCHNQTINIPGPGGATSYTWNGPSGVVSNLQNLVILNPVAAQSGVYQLQVDLNGCLTKDSMFVNVFEPMKFTIIPRDTAICKGASVPVLTEVKGGSGVISYSWTPAFGLSVPVGSVNVLTPQTNVTYYIVVSDATCPTLTIQTPVNITVNPLPVPTITTDKIEGCIPVSINFNSSSQPASTGTSWNFGANLNSFGDNVAYTFDKAGTYPIYVSIIDINGCKSTTRASFDVNAYPHPEPDFSWDPAEPNSNDNNVTFYPTFQNGPISVYRWFFGDPLVTQDSSHLKNPRYQYENVGVYPVTLIEKNVYGCTDTITKAVAVNEDFTLFVPNAFTPNGDGVNDVFLPKGLGFKAESFEMYVYDRWGTLIFKSNDANKGWDGTVKGQMVQSDVYVYKIKCISATKGLKKEAAGHVTLYK